MKLHFVQLKGLLSANIFYFVFECVMLFLQKLLVMLVSLFLKKIPDWAIHKVHNPMMIPKNFWNFIDQWNSRAWESLL